jgi:hypothetical protein
VSNEKPTDYSHGHRKWDPVRMDNCDLSFDRAVHRWVHWSVRSLFNWHCIYHKKEMNKITEIVRELLEKKPELRDNDNLLMSTIWKDQANIFNFFHRFESGRLHSPESIRRTRQKIQEDCPHLRGELYEARQKHQAKVKEELGYKI